MRLWPLWAGWEGAVLGSVFAALLACGSPGAVPFESNRLLTSQHSLSVAAGRIGSTSDSFVVGRGVEEPRARLPARGWVVSVAQ